MKARILAISAFLAAAVITNGVAAPSAEKIESFKTMLRNVPKLEMPGKAATEVRNAKANDKKDTALALVYAAASVSPASVPAVVRSISRVAPEYGSEIMSIGQAVSPGSFSPTPSLVNPQKVSVAAAEITPAGTAVGNQGAPCPVGSGGPRTLNLYIGTKGGQYPLPPQNYTR